MKKIYIIFSTIMLLLSLLLSFQPVYGKEDYTDEKFDTIIDRQLALLKYAKQAKESKGKKRAKYLIKYFRALPSDAGNYFKLRFGKHYYYDADCKQFKEVMQYGKFYKNTLYVNDYNQEPYSKEYKPNPFYPFEFNIEYVHSIEENTPKRTCCKKIARSL
jgi:hypothetical protein